MRDVDRTTSKYHNTFNGEPERQKKMNSNRGRGHTLMRIKGKRESQKLASGDSLKMTKLQQMQLLKVELSRSTWRDMPQTSTMTCTECGHSRRLSQASSRQWLRTHMKEFQKK
jgi:hypothetical protein